MLDLSPETEHLLEQEAAREGISVGTLIRRTFARKTPPQTVDHATHVKSLLAEWQRTDGTPVAAPAPNDSDRTPSEALFHQWAQEAAQMTKQEREAEETLWQQFQQDIDAERRTSDMRLVFLMTPFIIEVLREIERRNASAQKRRLQSYCFQAGRFIPLTTAHLEAAAVLWAHARNTGIPTANDTALDGDIILCAQVQSLGLPTTDYVVATTNTKHLKPFINAEKWQNITP